MLSLTLQSLRAIPEIHVWSGASSLLWKQASTTVTLLASDVITSYVFWALVMLSGLLAWGRVLQHRAGRWLCESKGLNIVFLFWMKKDRTFSDENPVRNCWQLHVTQDYRTLQSLKNSLYLYLIMTKATMQSRSGTVNVDYCQLI